MVEEPFLRMREAREILELLEPFVWGELPIQMIFIHGPGGSGKTFCVSKILRELNGRRIGEEKIVCSYIDCYDSRGESDLWRRIGRSIGFRIPPGVSVDESIRDLVEFTSGTKRRCVIALDNFPYLLVRNQDILYTISRLAETSGKDPKLAFIMIGRRIDFLEKLMEKDPASWSSSKKNIVRFEPYDIVDLRSLIEHALEKRRISLDDDLINAIARESMGDAGFSMNVIESLPENPRREDVFRAVRRFVPGLNEELLRKLRFHHKLVLLSSLLCLKENPERCLSGKIRSLYERLCLSTGIKPRKLVSFYHYLRELEALGFLDLEVIGVMTSGGISTRVRCPLPVDRVLERLKSMIDIELLDARKEDNPLLGRG